MQLDEPDTCNRLPVAEITVVQKQHQGTHRKTNQFLVHFCKVCSYDSDLFSQPNNINHYFNCNAATTGM